MNKEFTLDQLIKTFLGPRGRLVSGSKSRGPAMAIYNSNMVVGDEVVWHGDIDLTKDRRILCGIADLFNITIDLYNEHDVRVFPFEVKDNKEMKEKHKKLIEKHTPVFTTKSPDKFAGHDYDEIEERNEKIRQEAIKTHSIYLGFLTPGGTEWKWYNTWYYKGPHYVYRVLRRHVKVFIGWPLSMIGYSEEKLSFWAKVKMFFKYFFKEIGYHRIAVKEGQSTWKELLFYH